MPHRISIVIADDHPIVREGMCRMIERESDFEILIECGDGETVLREALTRQPDVVILDIDMPRLNGLEVLKHLRENLFEHPVILMTVHSEKEFFDEAVRLGASGYVLKDTAAAEIMAAIRTVSGGERYVSPALTEFLLAQDQPSPFGEVTGLSSLSATERKILQMIADYKTTSQIAETLFISPLTVKTHRRNIALKLNLEGNHTLMKYAVENRTII